MKKIDAVYVVTANDVTKTQNWFGSFVPKLSYNAEISAASDVEPLFTAKLLTDDAYIVYAELDPYCDESCYDYGDCRWIMTVYVKNEKGLKKYLADIKAMYGAEYEAYAPTI